jgi:hypothetical protein
MITQSTRKTYSSFNFTRILFNIVIINDYKFYVDFKGIMFFDHGGPISPTNIIKDHKFINKFYQSLKINEEGINPSFPYLGEFWGEKNFLRFALAPIVYNHLENNYL